MTDIEGFILSQVAISPAVSLYTLPGSSQGMYLFVRWLSTIDTIEATGPVDQVSVDGDLALFRFSAAPQSVQLTLTIDDETITVNIT